MDAGQPEVGSHQCRGRWRHREHRVPGGGGYDLQPVEPRSGPAAAALVSAQSELVERLERAQEGPGGGHNAAHLKATLSCTLVDLARAMLAISRRINPECEHVQGDMRTVSLGRVFDCVLVHDAVSYMASRLDLASAIATAFAHTAPGGVAMFQPDFVAETFAPGTETGSSDAGARGLRYLEWRWLPEGAHETYVTDMAYLLRRENAVEVVHDRHVMGLFPRAVWLELIAASGFEPLTVPFEHSSNRNRAREVFLGLRPATGPAQVSGGGTRPT